MSVPLSDARLTAIRERVPSAVCPAAHPAEVEKVHVWVTGSLSGADRCSACSTPKSALDSDEAVLLAEVDRLRMLLAPAELANWAVQLQSADLIPHPAFACRSTTSGYEAAVQVATTDALTAVARERLLVELQVAFDATVCRVLGYRPASPTTIQLPEAASRCGTCGHSGSDHQHAGTACWVHLPKHPSDAVKICGCGQFTPTSRKEQ